jgi:lysophospholipase L1-like esterase
MISALIIDDEKHCCDNLLWQTGSSRRTFLKQAAVLSVPVISAPAVFDAFALSPVAKTGQNYTFLFQGDSITDGNRSRDMDWNHVLGHGYAYLIAARLWYQYPTNGFHFFNRGVSGNQITDLTRRWSEDTIALKPDLVSILIGINDTSNAVNGNKNCTVAGFENDYRALLKQTKQELPAVELVICEPFALPVGKRKDQWNGYQREITGRQEVARRLAEEFGAIYIPLQDRFNEAVKKYPPGEFWLWDGVHPMPNGHELIAIEWINQVGKKLKFAVRIENK